VDSVVPLSGPSGASIGTIAKARGDWGSTTFTLSGIEGPLFSLTQSACNRDDIEVKELSTDQVIGRVTVAEQFCDNGRYSITYPQELHIDHKLLLMVCICLFQLTRDTQG
jgi:hypothetical protein